MLAMIPLTLGVALGFVSFLMRSFVDPILAQNFLSIGTRPEWAGSPGLIFEYNISLEETLEGASILGLSLGVTFLGLSLLKSRLYNKWVMLAGVAVFGFSFFGYIASKILLYYYSYGIDIDPFLIFGWIYVLLYYKLQMWKATFLYFLLKDVGALIATWLFIVGVFHYRGREIQL